MANARAGLPLLFAIGSFSWPTLAQDYPAASPAGQRPLETGGLAPPSRQAPPPSQVEVARTLDRAEREDAGRGLEFVWVQVGAGYELAALTALSDDGLLPPGMATSSSGPALSASAGVRLVFVSLGASGRVVRTGDWDQWSLAGRAALHLPMGTLEPSFGLELGYVTLSSFDETVSGDLSVGGFGARLDAALDWYVNPLLSLGACGDASLTRLSSDGVPGGGGSGVGLSFGGRLVAGLHF